MIRILTRRHTDVIDYASVCFLFFDVFYKPCLRCSLFTFYYGCPEGAIVAMINVMGALKAPLSAVVKIMGASDGAMYVMLTVSLSCSLNTVDLCFDTILFLLFLMCYF